LLDSLLQEIEIHQTCRATQALATPVPPDPATRVLQLQDTPVVQADTLELPGPHLLDTLEQELLPLDTLEQELLLLATREPPELPLVAATADLPAPQLEVILVDQALPAVLPLATRAVAPLLATRAALLADTRAGPSRLEAFLSLRWTPRWPSGFRRWIRTTVGTLTPRSSDRPWPTVT